MATINKGDQRYFYNSPNKKEAVYHQNLSFITRLAEEEGEEIIIRDHTGAAVKVITPKR